MEMTFQDKVVIVTGSSMGIGKEIAREILLRGGKVVLNGRNKERLQHTFESFRNEDYPVIAISGDVSVLEDCHNLVNKTIEHFGKIDALVNNAGLSMKGALEKLAPEVVEKVLHVNVIGSIFPTQVAIPFLKKTKGNVLFIGSLAGLHGMPGFSIYSTSKMALTALVQALKIELYKSGIHVGIAYLGFTENDPDKVIYNQDGKIIPQPVNHIYKPASSELVARKIVRMLEKRRSRKVFSNLGILMNLMNRLFPSLVAWMLLRNFKKSGRG